MNLSMLNQARELKANLDKAQKELSKTIVEADAGKGAVKVTVNGKQKILSIKISPEVIDPKNAKKLEDLIMKALTDAIAKSQKVASSQLKGLTGGLKIPGLF
jgi:DNA-binding YbaB/EbfC family protein